MVYVCKKFHVNKFPPLLPFELSWKDVNGHCLDFIHELYYLLDNNFVEDCYSFLRFNYIHEFIKFAICTPNWVLFLNLALKFNRTFKLNGFITSNFRKIIINGRLVFCSEINFLCLQKKLRRRFFVQVLIKEITRRLNCFGTSKAIYTTGLPFLRPLLSANYFFHILNSQEQDIFYGSKSEKTGNKNQKIIKTWKKFNPLKKEKSRCLYNLKILRKLFKKKKIYKHFDKIDFSYWIRFVKGFKFTFINRNRGLKNKKSIVSFYSLPCKTIRGRKSFYFFDAYYYYGIQEIEKEFFLKETLIICKSIGFDLFYILDGQYTENFLINLKFKDGSNKINVYMLGLETEILKPNENGLIFF